MAAIFVAYLMIRARLNPDARPDRVGGRARHALREKLALLRAGIIPFLIFFA